MKNAQERGGEFIEKMNEVLILVYFFVILQNIFFKFTKF